MLAFDFAVANKRIFKQSARSSNHPEPSSVKGFPFPKAAASMATRGDRRRATSRVWEQTVPDLPGMGTCCLRIWSMLYNAKTLDFVRIIFSQSYVEFCKHSFTC